MLAELTNWETRSTWARHYTLPPPMNMMENHERREEVFVKQGTLMFDAIESVLLRNFKNRSLHQLEILDFGAGVGRVALPFYFKYRRPSHCVDVDGACIDYLQRVIPGAAPKKIENTPPTRFQNETFDAIYAISVWTHLPLDRADEWMREIIRILKPGGVALITTSNYAGLEVRGKTLKGYGWADVTAEQLSREGAIFKATPAPAGVSGVYGYTSYDPAWLQREWSAKYAPVTEIVTGGILGVQDINVLQKPRRTGRGR
jgi:SAM-dependent methyltransferase